MKNWKVTPFGILESLSVEKVSKAIEYVNVHKVDILTFVAFTWGCVLALVFTLIATVRIAMHLPL